MWETQNHKTFILILLCVLTFPLLEHMGITSYLQVIDDLLAHSRLPGTLGEH